MKTALIAASMLWLCLLVSPRLDYSASAKLSVGQADKPTERDTDNHRDSYLRSLYEAHQWFKLRDAIQTTTNVSPFYRGTVACAFNDFNRAEKYLQQVIKSAPHSEQANEARGLLTYLYQRNGHFRQALTEVEEMLKATPDAAGAENARALFNAFSQYPEQSVTARQPSTVRYLVKGDNLFIPFSINGRAASYILDTGANFSALSESEAKRLGLTINELAAQGTDSTGGAVSFRTAVADRLTVGKASLRHVAFLVLRDDQQPFVDLPSGERGAVGLPVLLALQTLGWNSDGTLEISFHSRQKRQRKANICFEGAMPVIEAGFRQSKLNLVLDTGSSKTDLWPVFAKEFASVLNESGKRDSRRVTGVGNSIEIEAVRLPEVTLRIGGFDTVLRPAYVLLKTVGDEWYHGRLGFNVLKQARRVTLDFKFMRLSLD
jgi:tetratricopeptide (TPR) repeat protein